MNFASAQNDCKMIKHAIVQKFSSCRFVNWCFKSGNKTVSVNDLFVCKNLQLHCDMNTHRDENISLHISNK
jgi:hypothetical protein